MREWEDSHGQQRSTAQGLKSQGVWGEARLGVLFMKQMARQKLALCEREAGPPLPYTPCSAQHEPSTHMTLAWDSPVADPQQGKSDWEVGILGKWDCPSLSCTSLVDLEVVAGTVAALL